MTQLGLFEDAPPLPYRYEDVDALIDDVRAMCTPAKRRPYVSKWAEAEEISLGAWCDRRARAQ